MSYDASPAPLNVGGRPRVYTRSVSSPGNSESGFRTSPSISVCSNSSSNSSNGSKSSESSFSGSSSIGFTDTNASSLGASWAGM